MKCLHYFVEYCWCWIEFRYSFVFGYECVNTRANREFHSRALLSFLTSANVIRAQGNFNKSWKNSIILHRLEMREREAWRAVGSIKWSRSRLTFYHYLLATRRGWLHVAWRRDRLGSVPSSPTSLKALSLSLTVFHSHLLYQSLLSFLLSPLQVILAKMCLHCWKSTILSLIVFISVAWRPLSYPNNDWYFNSVCLVSCHVRVCWTIMALIKVKR